MDNNKITLQPCNTITFRKNNLKIIEQSYGTIFHLPSRKARRSAPSNQQLQVGF